MCHMAALYIAPVSLSKLLEDIEGRIIFLRTRDISICDTALKYYMLVYSESCDIIYLTLSRPVLTNKPLWVS